MSMPNFDIAGVSCQEAVANLIQSIAMEEAALSHILNAEGMRLEKCIEKACTCGDPYKLDVSDTLKDVFRIQLLLQMKLEEANKIKCYHKPRCPQPYFEED